MNIQHYNDLIYQLCTHIGIDHAAFNETGAVSIDGLDMLLFYDEGLHPDQMTVRFDFGPLEHANFSDLCKQMLYANCVVGLDGGCIFSLLPDLDHVILTVQAPLLPIRTGAEMAEVLQMFASHASAAWSTLQEALSQPAATYSQAGMSGGTDLPLSLQIG